MTDEHIPQARLILALYTLKILRLGPAHGNLIAEEIKRRSRGFVTPNTNALYPLLRKLEDRGFVSGNWDHPDRRCKRVYAITPPGEAYIATLENKAAARFDEMEHMIALLRKNLLSQSGDDQK